MTALCLIKWGLLAALAQIGIIALSVLARSKTAFLYIYLPWMWLVEQLAGPEGSGGHAMAGAATLGMLLGFVGYSLLASVIICQLKSRK